MAAIAEQNIRLEAIAGLVLSLRVVPTEAESKSGKEASPAELPGLAHGVWRTESNVLTSGSLYTL